MAVAMEGSTKWRFADVRMAVLERRDGAQACKSSTTKIHRNALMYKLIDFSDNKASEASMSALIV